MEILADYKITTDIDRKLILGIWEEWPPIAKSQLEEASNQLESLQESRECGSVPAEDLTLSPDKTQRNQEEHKWD